jgi:putative hydrolase of the HAD superfamily
LEELRGAGYRLGIIANQPTAVRDAMTRDGLVGFIEVWGVSDDLGLQKPDVALFEHALEVAGVPAGRTVMVGDRLDYDVAPARASGMRTVWVLRGEAPDDPTPEQLAVADASVRDLGELAGALAAL